jgi:hypothetical protein
LQGDAAAFKEHVAVDGWAIDPMMGLMSVADFLKGWDAMAKDMKVASWDITDSKVLWVDANTAVHSYKWTGKARCGPADSESYLVFHGLGQEGRKWSAVFHQETMAPPPPKK